MACSYFEKVLLLLKKLVKYGFFKRPDALLPYLINLLSKESDFFEETHHKFSTYDFNQYTADRMVTLITVNELMFLEIKT